MHLNYLANISRYVPEMFAVMLMLGLILLETTYKKEEGDRLYVFILSAIGLLGVFSSLITQLHYEPTQIFNHSITVDHFGTVMKMCMTLATFGAIYLSRFSNDIYHSLKTEFAILAVGILVGGMLLVSANNFLTFYLGIETLSIISYVMASMKKNNEQSSEAGLKYALYGGLSAGVMLFGMSHIYGVLGTIQFSEMGPLLMNLSAPKLLIIMPSFLLFFAGIGYKIAAAPFHMWSPDVYEGSPTPVTLLFATVPKLAGIAALLRVTMTFCQDSSYIRVEWLGLLIVVAALTMTVGNVTAIGQKSLKRMLAYSSISHAGVMISGIVVLNSIGIKSILFYSIAYIFMTTAAFFIASIVQDHYGSDHFDCYTGLIYKHPLMAIVMSVVMFSLTGLPPLAGFTAKFNILSSLIAQKYYSLAIVLAINSVISAYYYLKIVRLMTLKPAQNDEQVSGFGFLHQLVIALISAPIIILGIGWSGVFSLLTSAKLLIH